METEKRVVRTTQTKETPQQAGTNENFSVEGLVARVETMRDREFQREPTFVAYAGESLPAAKANSEGESSEVSAAVVADREAIYRGLMGKTPGEGAGFAGGLERLARYDVETGSVVYAAEYPDLKMLRLAVVRALVAGLNHEHFGGKTGAATSWDEALALEASLVGDAMFVGAQVLLKKADGEAIAAGDLARFPEAALRAETLRRAFQGLEGVEGAAKNMGMQGFSLREGYALAAAMYRANGWSAVEVLKYGPPRSSGYVVRPDRWFAGEDLGTWTWPAELEAGWDAENWHASVQRGRIGPAILAMWLGNYVDPAAARTVYAGWRSDAYRLHSGKRVPSARRKGAIVFEWVSQWDTPHSAEQVANAFRAVLTRSQGQREDDARHMVVQKGVNVAVIVTDSDADGLREESELVDRAAVLSGAVVRYGQVQGPPFVFQPTRLEAFLVDAAEARLDEFWFDDPASGVRMDLRGLQDRWEVQKTDEASIRWFARPAKKGDESALIQFTTELRDVLGYEFGSEGYRARMEEVFGASLGVAGGKNGGVVAEVLEVDEDRAVMGKVVEIRGQGTIDGKPRALWVRQFLSGDVVGTLSLLAAPEALEGQLAVVQAIFEGISVQTAIKNAENAGDEVIRIEIEE